MSDKSIILQCVAAEKDWSTTVPMKDLWSQQVARGFPKPYSFSVALMINGVGVEGVMVKAYYKPSRVPGVRDKLYFNLVVNEVQAYAIHDNGPSNHVNNVGNGLRYYREKIDHPHVHTLTDGDIHGYAEPLPPMSQAELWSLFITGAGIHGAPAFELPPGQMMMMFT